MAKFASGSSHGLRYIKEKEFGVTPENPVMRAVRHTSCSLVLNKDSFQSNELRRDAQISDLRHGIKQANGDIGIELSYAEFDDFLAGAIRGEWKNDVLVAGIDVPTFTFERVFEDIKQYQTFTGCAINTLSLNVQSNAMITGTLGIVGKGVDFSDEPTAAEELPSFTHSPLDGFHAALKEGGIENAVITAITLNIDNGIETANALGTDEAVALIPARINLTGTVSAFFENMDMLNKFVLEKESEIEFTLGDGGPGSYIFKIPRIKYSGGSNPVDGEGPIMLDMPFQALLDECTGTNLIIERIPIPEEVAEPCALTYSDTSFTESDSKPGIFENTITVTLSGGNGKEFSGRDGVALPGVSIANLPTGLKSEVIRTSPTTAEIKLSGIAASHAPADSGTFTINFPAAAFSKGLCHCAGDTVTNAMQEITVTFVDEVPPDTEVPVMTASTPANGDTDVATTGLELSLTFNEDVKAGTGNITISDNAETDPDIHTIDITTATISGTNVTATVTGVLTAATQYSVTIPSGAITDLAGNAFAGIADGELSFTTAAE